MTPLASAMRVLHLCSCSFGRLPNAATAGATSRQRVYLGISLPFFAPLPSCIKRPLRTFHRVVRQSGRWTPLPRACWRRTTVAVSTSTATIAASRKRSCAAASSTAPPTPPCFSRTRK